MKKSTKGALAASAAGVLLLGGAGSLAYWSESKTADAGTLASGNLTLSAVTCAGWLEGGAAIVKIVPGDTVTNDCTATLTLVGDHIGATVTLDASTVAAVETAFGGEVDISAATTATLAGVNAPLPLTDPGAYTVAVTLTAAFDGAAATNVSRNVTQTLSALQLTATQTHNP